jgi:carbon-monoxide dehydrogenase small subunit
MSQATKRMKVTFRVNGQERTVETHPLQRLLDTLREELHLTGTKEGCGEGECGACTVMLDGKPVLSCLVPTCQARGSEVSTIENLSKGEQLHPMQQCFLEEGGAQCGICTPGMILAAVHYMENPSVAEDMREALAGNQCRCTGYTKIFRSVERAMKEKGVTPKPGCLSMQETWKIRKVME